MIQEKSKQDLIAIKKVVTLKTLMIEKAKMTKVQQEKFLQKMMA